MCLYVRWNVRARSLLTCRHMAELLLHVKPKQHNVSVLNDVIFSFQADESFFFCRCMGTARHQVVITDHLRADESPLKIGMDLSCRLRSLCAFFFFLRAHLRLTCRQVTDKPEQMITCFDQFLKAGLFKSQII